MNAESNLRATNRSLAVFTRNESSVRSYCRTIPGVFNRARGARIEDTAGRSYIDFLAGAGSLNYGHNHPDLLEPLVEYLRARGITHSLDLHTTAKADFLDQFESLVQKPRGLSYVVQFTGPTGANAVEAAMKLARKVTGRSSIVAFTNGFHGVSLGALAATGNRHHRQGAAIDLGGVARMPFDGYLGAGIDTLDYFAKALNDRSSGIDRPAAVIVETVQGEGGLNVARDAWLQRLEALCREHRMLLIVDDIQAGCGRTGPFFSFEPSGIRPDMVTLSKSLSGMGLPFAITLIRREIDQWLPGEHNGTFRGNNHAFVTASAALRTFWRDDALSQDVERKGAMVAARLDALAAALGGDRLQTRGRGLMRGVAFTEPARAATAARLAFERGLIIETSGPDDEVIKCMCPLTIDDADLDEGLAILEGAIADTLAGRVRAAARDFRAQGAPR